MILIRRMGRVCRRKWRWRRMCREVGKLPKTTNMHSLPQHWVRGPLPQMSQFRPNLSRGRKMRSLVSKRGKKTLEGECRCSSYISRTIEPILRHQISTNFFNTFIILIFQTNQKIGTLSPNFSTKSFLSTSFTNIVTLQKNSLFFLTITLSLAAILPPSDTQTIYDQVVPPPEI